MASLAVEVDGKFVNPNTLVTPIQKKAGIKVFRSKTGSKELKTVTQEGKIFSGTPTPETFNEETGKTTFTIIPQAGGTQQQELQSTKTLSSSSKVFTANTLTPQSIDPVAREIIEQQEQQPTFQPSSSTINVAQPFQGKQITPKDIEKNKFVSAFQTGFGSSLLNPILSKETNSGAINTFGGGESLAFTAGLVSRIPVDVIGIKTAIKVVPKVLKTVSLPTQIISQGVKNAPGIVKLGTQVTAGLIDTGIKLKLGSEVVKLFEDKENKLQGKGLSDQQFDIMFGKAKRQEFAATTDLGGAETIPGKVVKGFGGVVRGVTSLVIPGFAPEKDIFTKSIEQQSKDIGLTKHQTDLTIKRAETQRKGFEFVIPISVINPEALANVIGDPIKKGMAASTAFAKRFIPGVVEASSARFAFLEVTGDQRSLFDFSFTQEKPTGSAQIQKVIGETTIPGKETSITERVKLPDGFKDITTTTTPSSTFKTIETTPATQAEGKPIFSVGGKDFGKGFKIPKALDIATFGLAGGFTAGGFGAFESKLVGKKGGDIITNVVGNILDPQEGIGDIGTSTFLVQKVNKVFVPSSAGASTFNFDPDTVVNTRGRTVTETKSSKTTTSTSVTKTNANIFEIVKSKGNKKNINTITLPKSITSITSGVSSAPSKSISNILNFSVTNSRSEVTKRTKSNVDVFSKTNVNINNFVNVGANTNTNTRVNVFTPKLPIFPFGGSSKKKTPKKKKRKKTSRFLPSAVATAFNIRGKTSKRLTGFEVRKIRI